MNRVIEDQYPLFRLYQRLRKQLLAALSDTELAFTPGGGNPPLGRLCVEIGETQQSYIDSFRTRRLNFDYRHQEADALATSIARLEAWYAALDEALYAAVAGWSDEEIAAQPIDRGGGFTIPAGLQLEIYKEALIIFYAKATVYLKLLGITPSEQWHEWMG